MVVEPLAHIRVLLLVQIHADGFKRLHVEYIVTVVEGRLFVVERWKTHPLEVAAVTLLPTHQNPRCPPLRHKDRLYDHRNLVDKRNGAGNVIQNLDVANLLPRHRHVFEKLQEGMRHKLQRPQVDSLVAGKFFVCHVAVVADDLAYMLRRHGSLLGLGHVGLLDRLRRPLLSDIGLLPSTRLGLKLGRRHCIVRRCCAWKRLRGTRWRQHLDCTLNKNPGPNAGL